MKKVMKIVLFVMTFFFISCSKSTEPVKSNSASDLLLFHDYINYYNKVYKTGDLIKFTYNGQYSYSFGFSNYRSRFQDFVTSFNIYTGTYGPYYDLNMRKIDSGIVVGQVYTNNVSFICSVVGPNSPSKTATSTELLFTKFQNPGIVEGSFKAYMNSVLWCDGKFSFNLK
jgi:hypothetical protein